MILTNEKIKSEVEKGNIVISPFTIENLGPNSYDVTLNKTLLIYRQSTLDCKKDNSTQKIEISKNGTILLPGQLYIGCTNECATSDKYVPMYEGRSSMGRLGISSHITAGFGDIGWGFLSSEGKRICTNPTWTLEITVVKPTIIYPNIRIGQVYFLKTFGSAKVKYTGKYTFQDEPISSRSFADIEHKEIKNGRTTSIKLSK